LGIVRPEDEDLSAGPGDPPELGQTLLAAELGVCSEGGARHGDVHAPGRERDRLVAPGDDPDVGNPAALQLCGQLPSQTGGRLEREHFGGARGAWQRQAAGARANVQHGDGLDGELCEDPRMEVFAFDEPVIELGFPLVE